MKPQLLIASLLIISLSALTLSVRADVKLPALFSDHAVLLSGTAVPVWGWAGKGEKVEVSFAGQTKSATPDANGKWMIKLDALKANAMPQELTVKGKNTLTVKDVLVGEVWLGSGQSNMAFQVLGANDFGKEKAAANLPQVRMFTVKSAPSAKAEPDCVGSWVLCSPETVGNFSAVLYFFGREIHKNLGVPTGLIHSSVGGTRIEAWTAAVVQPPEPAAKKKSVASKAEATDPSEPADSTASSVGKDEIGWLFNGKIAPLIPYAIRGAIWSQGENNAKRPAEIPLYHKKLALLITDWRKRWSTEFPFAWVQLPNVDSKDNRWTLMREQTLKALSVPKTGMAISIDINTDIGDKHNGHPKNKQESGRRLSLWALGDVYGKKVASTSGPLPAGHEVKGDKIVLKFTHADGGLAAKDGELRSFQIAGEDKHWKPATAQIVGDTVIVHSPEIAKPVAVRYAWKGWPDCNLYNGAGLPASPFRTDDWK